MKQYLKKWLCVAFCSGLAVIAGCGNNNLNTNPVIGGTPGAPAPGVASAAKRAFVVNQFASAVDVVDSQNDVLTGSVLQVNTSPTGIIGAANGKTLVYSPSSVFIVDNATETALGTVNNFPGTTESVVVTPDGLFLYAAIPSLGQIAKIDLSTSAITDFPLAPATPLPGVRRLAISHNGNTILAFSDNNDNVTFIDRANSDTVSAPLAGFDRPYTAVFSADDSTAYVLNCGKECGGAAASIAVVNMTTKAITTIPVRAATAALLDGNSLYVAGTDVVASVGRLDVLNVSTLAAPTAVATPISDGKHTKMALASNSKLYIGSTACSNSGGQCLSVYNTSSGAAAVLAGNATYPAIGDVTAITPIAGRNVVYIIQGGTLVIYDTATDAPQANQIFIQGKVSDVIEVK